MSSSNTDIKHQKISVIDDYIIDNECSKKGIGLFSKTIGGTFGQFLKTFKKIFTKEQREQYRLPSTIVVGSEKTGKSSLLENITKCSIFPKIENKICTKCPIRLRLFNDENKKYLIQFPKVEITEVKNSSDIYNHIDNYMKNIKDGTISEDEIIVSIYGPDMPYFEFVDLPGIVAVGSIAKATEDLVRKYINDKNNIILCVVPATFQRINTYSPLAIIKELNALDNTIVALTMTDKVPEDYIDLQITDRLLKISDEFQEAHVDSVLAVINHSQRKNRTLIENNDYEQAWFQQNIFNNKDINSKYNENDIKKINNLVSSNNIIQNLDVLYNKYMNTNWKPKVINEINNKITIIQKEYDDLGIHVDKIDKKVFQNLLLKKIQKVMINTVPYHELSHYACSNISGSTYKEFMNSLDKNLNKNINHFISGLVLYYDKCIINIFDSRYIGDESLDNANLHRFTFMKQFIITQIDKFTDEFIKLYGNDIYMSSKYYFNAKFMDGLTDWKNGYNSNAILRLIKELIIDNIIEKISEIDLSQQFIENEEFTKKRAILEQEFRNLTDHKDKISEL